MASLYPLSACLILELTRGSAVWINTSVNHGFAIWIYILVDVPLYSLPLIVSRSIVLIQKSSSLAFWKPLLFVLIHLLLFQWPVIKAF
jgi:hypothetical protein